MTIALKLNDLVNSNQALLELGEALTLPAPAAFKIARVIRKSRDEVRGWTEQRTRIMRDLFKDNPKALRPHPQSPGDVWLAGDQISMEQADALNALLTQLGDTEITIDAGKITMTELGEKTALKPNVLAALDWLIVEKL